MSDTITITSFLERFGFTKGAYVDNILKEYSRSMLLTADEGFKESAKEITFKKICEVVGGIGEDLGVTEEDVRAAMVATVNTQIEQMQNSRGLYFFALTVVVE
jgi:hypothetical protein